MEPWMMWTGVGVTVFIIICIWTKGKVFRLLGDILEAIFD